MHPTKLFTVERAQRALVYIRPILDQMCATYRDFKRVQDEVMSNLNMSLEAKEAMIAGMKAMRDEVNGCIDEIVKTGASVKDLDTGLVDFSHTRADGEIVVLCYKLGEPEILYWHTKTEGVSGRRPLSELNEVAPAATADSGDVNF